MTLQETKIPLKGQINLEEQLICSVWKGKITTFMMAPPEAMLRAMPSAELDSSTGMVQRKGFFLGLSLNNFTILLSLVITHVV